VAVEVVPHRPTLVAQLQRLGVERRLLVRAADPAVADTWFAGAGSVAFWAEVLASAAVPDRGVPDELFPAVAAAYLDRWRVEQENEQLMAAARALARAARAHRPDS
jgi:hypothetical protein